MSEKNFKIGSAGLDLDGGLLLTNVLSNAVSFNGNPLASQQYVDNAIGNIDTDLSDNAGQHLLWDAGSSTFAVNVNSLVGELNGEGLYVSGNDLAVNTNVIASRSYVDSAINAIPSVNTQAIAESLASSTLYVSDTDNLNINVNALVTELDGSGLYVDGVTLAVNTNVIATKAYVDSVAQGLDVKASVKLASIDNISGSVFIYPGLESMSGLWNAAGLDGVAVGDRVLLKNQIDSSENGIYVVSSPMMDYYKLDRAEDATVIANGGGGTLTKGAFTFVEGGTSQGKGFVANLGNNGLVEWTQFSEAGSLTAGTNIYLSNNQINVNVNSLVGDLAGTGLYVSGNDLAVNVNALAGAGLATSAGQFIIDQYAAGVRYDGTVGAGGNSSVTTDTLYATTSSSDTYVTVGTISGNKAFTLDVYMKAGSDTRKSTISGVGDGSGTVEYTEYAIVDSATPITSPDILIEWDGSGGPATEVYNIKAKATIIANSSLQVVIDSKTIGL